MSLSPNFIDTPKTINEYISTLTAIYDQSGSTPANKMRINSSADLIDGIQLRELYTDILIFKCPLPENLKDFRQIGIPADTNCLFHCLSHLQYWNRKDGFRRASSCPQLRRQLSGLRIGFDECPPCCLRRFISLIVDHFYVLRVLPVPIATKRIVHPTQQIAVRVIERRLIAKHPL